MVNGLFQRETFAGFGPCALDPCEQSRPIFTVRGRRPARLRLGVSTFCPRQPGVYGMIDRLGEMIYVGKAKVLRSRLLSYFRPNSRDEKAGKIIAETRRIIWEPGDSEFGALLRELELIRRWQPRFNVQGKPRRHRRCYVCIGRRPAPHAFVATRPPRTAMSCFGPLAGLHQAREAVRWLNDWYRLRDCPQKQTMIFADQNELFPMLHAPGCLRHEIGNCLAPCAAACTQGHYAFHVEAAVDFLQGKDDTPLEQLQKQMIQASNEQLFEKAAMLRDRLESLRGLRRQLDRLRQATRQSGVYSVLDHQGGQTWYLIRDGSVRARLPAPVDEWSRRIAAERLEEVFVAGCPGPPGLDEADGLLLVAGWFRKQKEEKERLLSVEAARALAGGDFDVQAI